MKEHVACVRRVKDLLARSASSSGEDLAAAASEYLERCSRALKRLDEVLGCIARNQRAQAIHLAETPPPLLEIIAVLDFDGVEDWRQLVEKHGLPSPEGFDSSKIMALEDAYSQNDALEPLLKSYRRMAMKNAPAREKISVLRRIRMLDSGNAIWSEDLGQLEIVRFKEILSNLNAKAGQLTESEASGYLTELTDPELVMAPVAHMVEKARQIHTRLRTDRIHALIKDLARQVSNSYAAMDVHAVGSLLEEVESLTRREKILVPSDVKDEIDDARTWFEEQKGALQEEAKFIRDVEKLDALLDDESSGPDVRKQLRLVEKHDKDVAGGLLNRARSYIESLEQAERRKRRTRRGAVAVVVVGGVFCVALIARQILKIQRQREAAGRIFKAINGSDLVGARTAVDAIQQTAPSLLDAAIVKEAIKKLERSEKKEQKRKDRLSKLMTEGSKLPGVDVRHDELLAEAKKLATTDSEKATVSAWSARVATARRTKSKEVAKRAAPFFTKAATLCRQLSDVDKEDELRSLIGQLESVLTNLVAMGELPEELEQSRRDLRSRMEAQKKRLATLSRIQEKQKKTVNDARKSYQEALKRLPNVNAYAQGLSQHQEQYAGQPPFKFLGRWENFAPAYDAVVQYGRVIKNMARKNVSSGSDNPTGIRYGDFREWVADWKEDGPQTPYSPWLAQQKKRALYIKNPGAPLRKIKAILQHDLFVKIHLFEVEDQENHISSVYYTDDKAKIVNVGNHKKQMGFFEDSTLQIKNKMWDDRRFSISQPRLAPHGKLAKEVLSLLEGEIKSPGWRSSIPLAFLKIARAKSVNPWPHALLLKRFNAFDSSIGRPSRIEDPLDQSIKSIMPKEKLLNFWLLQDRSVKAELDKLARKIEAVAPSLEKHLQQAMQLDTLRSIALCRGLVLSGVANEGAKGMEIDGSGGKEFPEYWIISQQQGSVVFEIVAYRAASGRLMRVPGANVAIGQPLLSPIDKKDTLRLLKRYQGGTGGSRVVSPWPVNSDTYKKK